jgi:hypothetical protein
MNPMFPLAVATLLYAWQSINYTGEQRIGMMITFIGYAIANIGLIIDFYEMKT